MGGTARPSEMRRSGVTDSRERRTERLGTPRQPGRAAVVPVAGDRESPARRRRPSDPGWVDAEAYWAVPDLHHAKLLVPRGGRDVTAGAIENYRGLRLRRKNVMRAAVGVMTRRGLPVLRHPVSLQVSRDHHPRREHAAPQRPERRPGRPAAPRIDRDPHRRQPEGDVWPWSTTTAGRWGTPSSAGTRSRTPTCAPRPRCFAASVDASERCERPPSWRRPPTTATRSWSWSHSPRTSGARRGRIAPLTSEELYALTPVVRVAAPGDTRTPPPPRRTAAFATGGHPRGRRRRPGGRPAGCSGSPDRHRCR